ncbi:MAG: hypothetical protein WKG07_11780 [Hymenobacter sp.]
MLRHYGFPAALFLTTDAVGEPELRQPGRVCPLGAGRRPPPYLGRAARPASRGLGY